VIFGLSAGVVGTLMVLAYADLTPFAPAPSSLAPQGLPQVVVDLPPVPDRDLARSVVRFSTAADARSAAASSIFIPSDAVRSGAVLTSDGWVITYDDVDSDEDIDGLTAFVAGRMYDVERSVRDPYTGITFVKVDGHDLPVTPFGRNASLEVGTVLFGLDAADGVARLEVLAMGTRPERTVADAIRSSERIQMYARVTSVPGMLPGSLLADGKGDVVALIVGGNEYGHTAISVDDFLGQVSSVLRSGATARPLLGVRYVDLSRSISPDDPDSGARIGGGGLSVLAGSPAARAGLRTGDIIIAVNGERVTDMNPLPELIAQYAPGESVSFEYVRGSEDRTVDIVLGTSE
jgi:S1-C subfamily serine protease